MINASMKRAEIHVHSTYSDGKDPVKKLVEQAVRLGLDAISITDHDTIQGSLSAMDYVRDENLSIEIIPGMEISTADGHLLALFIEREIDKGMPMDETIEEVKKAGGVAVISHPFQIFRKGAIKFNLLKISDGVEVFNARYVLGMFNKISEKLAKKYGKAITAGSDAHSSNEIGYGITLYQKDLKMDILEGKTTIQGRRIPLRILIENSIKKRI